MELGLHLPVLDLGGGFPTLAELGALVTQARRLGFGSVAANDHLVFGTPWLDGPTALAAVASTAGDLELMTTVALPTVRGPAPLAKQLAALQLLSGGRVIAGVGPGSSPADHAAVGADFVDRWPAFDRSVAALRRLLDGDPVDLPGITVTASLEPIAVRRVPLWIGSWGSPAGLRRVARVADGWLASAYNTTPDGFRRARAVLDGELERRGRDPRLVPDGLSTGFLHLTDSSAEAERFLDRQLAPALRRTAGELAGRVLVGTADDVGELVSRYRAAGLGRLLVWPLVDRTDQLSALAELAGAPAIASNRAAAS